MKAFTPHKFLYGACYYHEYNQVPRLDKDFELMQEGGLSVLRVGESVWSLWEPSDDSFLLVPAALLARWNQRWFCQVIFQPLTERHHTCHRQKLS